MSLREDIEELASSKKLSKLELLLKVKREIKLMIKKKIPLPKQIELLIKNEVIENIDLKYYREILKKEFGYNQKIITKQKEIQTLKKEKKQDISVNVSQTPTEILSQNIELKF